MARKTEPKEAKAPTPYELEAYPVGAKSLSDWINLGDFQTVDNAEAAYLAMEEQTRLYERIRVRIYNSERSMAKVVRAWEMEDS